MVGRSGAVVGRSVPERRSSPSQTQQISPQADFAPKEAFSGFGSVAVIMVTAMFVFSAALVRTVAHETTMLVMGPARYRFKHYLSIGAGMAIVAWLLATLVIPLVWRP